MTPQLPASAWRGLIHIVNVLQRSELKGELWVGGDFVTSIMLYTYDTRPISLEILGSLRQGDMGVAAAYGVLLMIASAMVFALGSRGEARP